MLDGSTSIKGSAELNLLQNPVKIGFE